ncbi:hypothetical protein [Psychrobacter sp. FME5]|uniref:hypothetical protein n=1 Tax=unclassified Psychrobacter TaxID=196806 RepID=UPI001787FD3C|nr:hypothetical protein [Psychrobacter sp. FME5]MBE0444809.1 hypothetical protein [Psychrobacter sp. FME5]
MNIQPKKTLSVSLQTQSLDFRALSTFDVMMVHHSQTELIEEINSAFPDAIHSLQQELLSYHMIDSPVMITLISDILNILEVHLQQCELLSHSHGLLALLDYTAPNRRAHQTRMSAKEYLPDEIEWQQIDKDINALENFKLNAEQIAYTLSLNQIIQKSGKKKHFRYLDAQVLIHLLPLNQHAYIANRYGYPNRLWLSMDNSWYSLDSIHHYKPEQVRQVQRLPSYCPLTQNQLDSISTLNRFFAKKGIDGTELILNHYSSLLNWLDKANTQLTAATHLTNPVDRMTMMNRWLYECYEQSGLVTLDN